jgi:hypothetical protein
MDTGGMLNLVLLGNLEKCVSDMGAGLSEMDTDFLGCLGGGWGKKRKGGMGTNGYI